MITINNENILTILLLVFISILIITKKQTTMGTTPIVPKTGNSITPKPVGRKFYMWEGLVSQQVANIPTAIVRENTIPGEAIIWSRVGVGFYEGTLPIDIEEDYTTIYFGNQQVAIIAAGFNGTNKIYISTMDAAGVPQDSKLSRTPILIKIWLPQ